MLFTKIAMPLVGVIVAAEAMPSVAAEIPYSSWTATGLVFFLCGYLITKAIPDLLAKQDASCDAADKRHQASMEKLLEVNNTNMAQFLASLKSQADGCAAERERERVDRAQEREQTRANFNDYRASVHDLVNALPPRV